MKSAFSWKCLYRVSAHQAVKPVAMVQKRIRKWKHTSSSAADKFTHTYRVASVWPSPCVWILNQMMGGELRDDGAAWRTKAKIENHCKHCLLTSLSPDAVFYVVQITRLNNGGTPSCDDTTCWRKSGQLHCALEPRSIAILQKKNFGTHCCFCAANVT